MKRLVVLSLSISLASQFLILPVQVVAQSGQVKPLCQSLSDGSVYKLPDSGTCPTTGYKTVPNYSIDNKICVGKDNTAGQWNAWSPEPSTAPGGGYSCVKSGYSSIKLTEVSTSTPPATTPPTNNPPGQTPPIIPPTTTPTPPTTTPQPTSSGCVQKGPLCIPTNPFANSNGIAGSGSIGQLAVSIISILLYLAGIVAVIFIIVGGYYYMTAAGNDARALSGRKTLVNALIGLAIVILSFLIVQVLTNFLTQGT